MKPEMDDKDLPEALRRVLAQSSRAGQRYDVEGRLPELREALRKASADSGEQGGGSGAEAGGGLGMGTSSLLGTGTTASIALLGVAMAALTFVMLYDPTGPDEPHPPRDEATDARSAPAAPAQASGPSIVRPAPGTTADVPAATTAAEQQTSETGLPSRLEIAQMVRIRALLKRDPQAAYDLALRSQAQFASGFFVQERQAHMVLALAATGQRETARVRARAFVNRYPDSPLRAAVEAVHAD